MMKRDEKGRFVKKAAEEKGREGACAPRPEQETMADENEPKWAKARDGYLGGTAVEEDGSDVDDLLKEYGMTTDDEGTYEETEEVGSFMMVGCYMVMGAAVMVTILLCVMAYRWIAG